MLCKFSVSALTANVNSSMPVGLTAECARIALEEEIGFIVLFHISMVRVSEFNL